MKTTLTRKQAAERLGISIATFERLRAANRLPAPIESLRQRPLLWDADEIEALRS